MVRMLDFTLSIYDLPLDHRAAQPGALSGGSDIPWVGLGTTKSIT